MAWARALDVFTGALASGPEVASVGGAVRRAAAPASLVGVDTGTLMALSRYEVRVPVATLAVSPATTIATAVPVAVRISVSASRWPAPTSAWGLSTLFRRLPTLRLTAEPYSLALSTSTVHGVRSLPVAWE